MCSSRTSRVDGRARFLEFCKNFVIFFESIIRTEYINIFIFSSNLELIKNSQVSQSRSHESSENVISLSPSKKTWIRQVVSQEKIRSCCRSRNHRKKKQKKQSIRPLGNVGLSCPPPMKQQRLEKALLKRKMYGLFSYSNTPHFSHHKIQYFSYNQSQ